jgi:hypothetical protein
LKSREKEGPLLEAMMLLETFLDMWMSGPSKTRAAFREDLAKLLQSEKQRALDVERRAIVREIEKRWSSGSDIDADWFALVKKFVKSEKG